LKIKTFIFFVLIFAILLPLPNAYAHNGSRDELGGHFRKSDCVYLLHAPTALAKSAKDINDLIKLIQENSTSSCVGNLAPDTIDLNGFTFSGSAEPAEVAAPKEQPKPTIELGETYDAKLVSCVDGDTANIEVNGTTYKTRFLFIDTPESTIQKEEFGKEASDFTCNFLKQGNITLETDGGDLFDKYNRLLAWVFVDGALHQEAITKAGFVEDFYDFGTYKYEDRIRTAMEETRASYAGMYANLMPPENPDVTKNGPANIEAEADRTQSTENLHVNSAAGEVGVKTDEQSVAGVESTEEGTEQLVANDSSEESNQSVGTVESSVESSEQSVADAASTEKTSGNPWIALFVLGSIILLFYMPEIFRKYGVQPLLVHKMRSRKRSKNILLGILYLLLYSIKRSIIPLKYVFTLRRN
jgi:micrococcal nuclease